MMSFVESCGSGFWYILLGALRSYAPSGWGFPVDISGEESACQAGDARDLGLGPGLGRSPAVGNGNPLQYSCLENPWTEESGRLQSMGSQECWTRLSDCARTRVSPWVPAPLKHLCHCWNVSPLRAGTTRDMSTGPDTVSRAPFVLK